MNCRALFWNPIRKITNRKGMPIKRSKKPHPCKFCGRLTTKPTYCNQQCYGYSVIQRHIDEGKSVSEHALRKYLIYLRGYKCEECGLSEWGKHKIPLETHHIDGNYFNNKLDNLMLICLNCHGVTDNYRAKNIGNGRPYTKYR